MKEYYTLKELADECGISKQAIRKRLVREGITPIIDTGSGNNRKLIPGTVAEMVVDLYRKTDNRDTKTDNQTMYKPTTDNQTDNQKPTTTPENATETDNQHRQPPETALLMSEIEFLRDQIRKKDDQIAALNDHISALNEDKAQYSAQLSAIISRYAISTAQKAAESTETVSTYTDTAKKENVLKRLFSRRKRESQ